MDNEGKADEGVEPTTPTTEEQVATLTTQLGAKTLEAEQATKSEQGLRASLKEKDRVIKSQTDINTRLDGLEEDMKLTIFAIQKAGNLEPAEGEDINKTITSLRENRKELQTQANYNQTANAIFDRAEVVITDKKELQVVKLLLYNQDPKGAEELVKDAEARTIEVKEVKPVETEVEMKARLLKELQAEDRKTETGMPAGGNSSDEDFVKKFASGELPATKANADRYRKIRDSY